MSMHASTRVALISVVVSSLAFAAPTDRPLLADSHGAVPVGTPSSSGNSGSVPVPSNPVVRHGKADIFLLGLGLAAGGLVLGGGGFALLYGCRDGTGCHGDVTTVLGWALAAPGLVPLAVGLIMMFAGSNSSRAMAPSAVNSTAWAVGVAPLREGLLISTGLQF